jgi:hypothetical protein
MKPIDERQPEEQDPQYEELMTLLVQPLSKVDNSIYSDLRLTGAQVSL